jgi:hypothetical protein
MWWWWYRESRIGLLSIFRFLIPSLFCIQGVLGLCEHGEFVFCFLDNARNFG